MNTQQRRDLIVQRILEQGRVQVADLVQEFHLTDTSIRHDLTVLEQMGLLQRIHGGAVSTSRSIQALAFNISPARFRPRCSARADCGS